ncbi:MAG: lytic transglycosylase domain-containing protein [Bryobacteraceae bacterium]
MLNWQRLAPGRSARDLRSIASVESAFNPIALSINYPEVAGQQLGLGQGKVELSRQPANLKEALGWARWFISNGQTVSVGLMQLNIEHLAGYKVTLERAFDPCENIRIGWMIFNNKYQAASAVLGKGQLAMHAALSAYNSGSLIGGFSNGYVAAVLAAAPDAEESEVVDPPYIEEPPQKEFLEPSSMPESAPETQKHKSYKMLPPKDASEKVQTKPPNPRTTGTKVSWDMKRHGPWVTAPQERTGDK